MISSNQPAKVETKKLYEPYPKKPTEKEILTAKLNSITFEDINKIDYKKLNFGNKDDDGFDPKKFLDLDSDDE